MTPSCPIEGCDQRDGRFIRGMCSAHYQASPGQSEAARVRVVQVLGVPAPQGSKTAVVRGGHARLIEGGSTVGRNNHRAWREAVAWASREVALSDGPVGDDVPLDVTVTFTMPKPKSRPKRAVWCDRKPDLDKLIRSTLDGLADGGLVRHDSRVVRIVASKMYAGPGLSTGAVVSVREADDVGDDT